MTLCQLANGLVDVQNCSCHVKHCDVEGIVVICHHHLVEVVDGNADREVGDALIANLVQELCIVVEDLNTVPSIVANEDFAILGCYIIGKFQILGERMRHKETAILTE